MSIMPHNPFNWLFTKLSLGNKSPNLNKQIKSASSIQTLPETTNNPPCCSNIVHIAYRGISDDRLYLAYDRKWQEVKYFRPKNLRIFCKECRKRIH